MIIEIPLIKERRKKGSATLTHWNLYQYSNL